MADAREVGGRFIEAFNAHDEERIRDLNGENTVFEAPGEVKVEGREAATEYAMGWLRAFPDARITVHNELAAGDWVVQEFTFTGTHDATLMSPAGEIPATHKTLNGRGVQIFRVEGETVADTRLYFDQVQVMTQLGLMPEPATA
jgi:steroid delta-isomerase-like uncharacterized protein